VRTATPEETEEPTNTPEAPTATPTRTTVVQVAGATPTPARRSEVLPKSGGGHVDGAAPAAVMTSFVTLGLMALAFSGAGLRLKRR
jgi:hypothetical protein